jgi:hypothetical protein
MIFEIPTIIIWRQPGTPGAIVTQDAPTRWGPFSLLAPAQLLTAGHVLRRLADKIDDGDVPRHLGRVYEFAGKTMAGTEHVAVVDFPDDNYRLTLPCGVPTPFLLWDAATFLQASANFLVAQMLQAEAMKVAADQQRTAQILAGVHNGDTALIPRGVG